MRIAIIGGRGLIGMAVARELRAAGHDAVLLSRKAEPGETVDRFEVREWDGLSADELARIIDGMDGLVNLAGESIGKGRWSDRRKQIIVDSRLRPAWAIVEAWPRLKAPPKVLVQASAMGFYGNTAQPVDESSPAGTGFQAELCVKWEASTEAVTQSSTRRVVIRSGLVLDRARGILPQMMLPFRLFVGGAEGSGSQWMSWIHIADEARAIRHLLEHEEVGGVYNLTSPQPVTNAEFGREIAMALRRPYWFKIPGFALRLALGEMSSLLLEGQKVLPTRLLSSGFEFKYPNLRDALTDLLSSQRQKV